MRANRLLGYGLLALAAVVETTAVLGPLVLDRTLDWDRLTGRVEAATKLIPQLRQRVEEPPAHVTAAQVIT